MAFVSSPLSCRTACTNKLTSSAFLSPRSNRSRTPKQTSARSRGFQTPLCSDMGLSFPERKYDGDLRIGIVFTRWNENYVQPLLSTIKSTLQTKGITDDKIVQMQVPGAWELPIAARLMCSAQKVDAVICVGVLIKGETEHYEYIAGPVSSGLMDLQLSMSIPIIFGVLCCTAREQAEKRSIGEGTHADEWALTAIEMGQLRKSQIGGVSAGKKSVGFF